MLLLEVRVDRACGSCEGGNAPWGDIRFLLLIKEGASLCLALVGALWTRSVSDFDEPFYAHFALVMVDLMPPSLLCQPLLLKFLQLLLDFFKLSLVSKALLFFWRDA